ncbi:DSBA-like thioredoxin domain protein, partial [Aspergillus sclerotialis]
WCYIGKRKLDKAISLYQKTYPGGKSDVFIIKWRPYYLDYNPHPHSVDKADLIDVWLSGMTPEQRTAMFNRITQIGRSVGITFKDGGKIGNTLDAHRLVHITQAKSPDIQNALVESIFEAYHELERDISERAVLRDLAVNAGIDATEVDECLESSLAADVVDEEARRNKETVNSGVPSFVIQGVHRVDGAEDPFEFIEIFAKVREGDLKAWSSYLASTGYC